ncbi:hypothetical protein IH824_10670 [candidate division KSB1 bacterium]|nr:hypothetical protein [candidate division KSB1 bacterium]
MDHQSVERSAQQKLASINAPWATGAAGLSIIVGAFIVSVVNASIDTPNSFVSMTLQPFIFVGLGLLLFHIGQHVHAMNQNVILMVDNMVPAEHEAPEPG